MELGTRCKDHCVHALSLVPVALVPEQAHNMLHNKKVEFGVLITVHVEGIDYSVLGCEICGFIHRHQNFLCPKDGDSRFSGILVVY